MDNSDIGDRMKMYESNTDFRLNDNSWVVIRLDMKGGHNFTRNFEKPFDYMFIRWMKETAKYLCENIQNACFAYTQSDEISIIMYNGWREETDAWFANRIQKIVSVSASMATMKFNSLASGSIRRLNNAIFDARAFSVLDMTEAKNYLFWRQLDFMKNSVQMLARSLMSHKQAMNKSVLELKDMLDDMGHPWDGIKTNYKYGSAIYKQKISEETSDGLINRSKWFIDDNLTPFNLNWQFLNEKLEIGNNIN